MTGTFIDEISKEIFEAFNKSVATYHLIKEDQGKETRLNIIETKEPVLLDKLCEALNRRFENRKYFVVKIENVQIIKFKRRKKDAAR